MSGSIQSSNYVPGVSSWKIDYVSGDFEINSAQIQVGTLPSDPQLITVTAGSWSEYDLPANALVRLAFIGAELEKIPAECRESAEFTTEDISFDRDGSDVRTSLTYERLETAEEVEARQKKGKSAGISVSIKNGLMVVTHDGLVRIKLGNLDQPEHEEPKPFKVDGGQCHINESFLADAALLNAKLHVNCMRGGGYTGDAPKPGDALKAGGVCATLDQYASKIGETKLGRELKEQIEKLTPTQVDQVKEIIRAELRQGGLLWRRR